MRDSAKRMRRRHFRAPLSAEAWAGGIAITVILWGLAVTLSLSMGRTAFWSVALAVVTLFLTPVISGLFAVLGYELHRQELRIRRLLWETRIPLTGLERAWVDPRAMKWAWKTLGNGGCFGWIGRFRNKRLGSFRALVTAPARCVVLDFGKQKLVVSPEDPAAFVRALGFDPDAEPGEER